MLGPSHYQIKTSVVPVGDWHYPQGIRGEINTRRAGSWEELVADVLRFRLDNNLPVGDPAADVSDYIRRHSPDNDLRAGKATAFVASTVRPITPLAERVKEHLISIEGRQLTFAGYDETRRRAAICAGCPQNISWESNCGQCNAAIRYKGNIVRRRAQFEFDSKLQGCRLHGVYLQAAVFLEGDALPPRDTQAPAQCWIPK